MRDRFHENSVHPSVAAFLRQLSFSDTSFHSSNIPKKKARCCFFIIISVDFICVKSGTHQVDFMVFSSIDNRQTVKACL